MNCQWQMGMLVMRPCGEPASAACAMCGRQLCQAHTVMGPAGPACPACAAGHGGYTRNPDMELAQARTEYYRPFGAALGLGALGYGAARYFSPADAAAMNRPGAAQPARQQKYDAMET